MADDNFDNRLRGAEQSIATLFERQAQRDKSLNEKLDSVMAAVKDEHGTVLNRQDQTNGRVGKLDGRVSVLERGQWIAMGGLGVVVTLMSVFGVWALTELS